ncbi:hypothetical protein GQX73_g1757 [Xylaria multiplex]|uniref:Uncharacterized protein n=1 Tax=Xylaria multiplex TaxID=323545 RepID=A0A7C8ITE4_9PEZI|nr:hypothetical protein GQX73_g1757 [Xylaria multiplex]
MPVTQGTQSPDHVHHYSSSLNTTTGENHTLYDEIEPNSCRGLERGKPEYRPVALRWPFLAAVLAALVITLVLLSSAINALPLMEDHAKHPAQPAGPSKSTPQSIKATGNVKEKATILGTEKSSQSFLDNSTSLVFVTTIACVSQTYYITYTGQGNYGQIGYQTVTTTVTQITTGSENYGQIGYQTITATVLDQETITKTVTETVKEVIRDTITKTITETMIPLPPLAASHGDLETIWVTKSLIKVTPSVSRGDIGDVVDKTIAVTYIALGSSKVAGSYVSMGNSKSTNVPDNVGEQTTSMVGVVSQVSLTHSGSFETEVITEDPLYYTTRKNFDVDNTLGQYTTEIPVVLIDPSGSPTTTSMAQISVATIEPDGDIVYIGDKIGTLRVTTFLNSGDSPIATLTISPDLIPSLTTTILTGAEGHPTATQIWTVMVTSSPSTEISNEVPTATISTPPVPPETYTIVYYIGPGQYFIGMFLPITITSLIAIFVRIISTNVNYFQPWHSLTHHHGASDRDSLFLQPSGWRSIFRSLRSLSSGEVVPFLANLLLILSAVLIPLSSEAISLDLRGECANEVNTAKNCAWVLSASPFASGACIVILVLMAFKLVLLLVILRKWHLGVYTNPRSICALASLSLNKEVQQLVAGTEAPLRDQHHDLIGRKIFVLRHFQLAAGKTEYGIVALDEPNEVQSRHAHGSDNRVIPLANRPSASASSKRQPSAKPFTLGYIRRLSLLFIISGVLVLVLYYSQNSSDTAFERFIDSDSFGLRFLFTSFGVVISFLWSSFFDSK